MKSRVILAINVVVVLCLALASAFLANRWREEGANYIVDKRGAGEVQKTAIIEVAKKDAQVLLTRYTALGEMEKAISVRSAESEATVAEARANTHRVKANNEITNAQVEAVIELERGANLSQAHGSGPIAPSVIDEGPAQASRGFRPAPGIDEGKATRRFQRATDPNDPFGAVGRNGKPSRGFQPSTDPKDPFAEVGKTKPKKNLLDKY
jgi:hypothetical protein